MPRMDDRSLISHKTSPVERRRRQARYRAKREAILMQKRIPAFVADYKALCERYSLHLESAGGYDSEPDLMIRWGVDHPPIYW